MEVVMVAEVMAVARAAEVIAVLRAASLPWATSCQKSQMIHSRVLIEPCASIVTKRSTPPIWPHDAGTQYVRGAHKLQLWRHAVRQQLAQLHRRRNARLELVGKRRVLPLRALGTAGHIDGRLGASFDLERFKIGGHIAMYTQGQRPSAR